MNVLWGIRTDGESDEATDGKSDDVAVGEGDEVSYSFSMSVQSMENVAANPGSPHGSNDKFHDNLQGMGIEAYAHDDLDAFWTPLDAAGCTPCMPAPECPC